jgi:predicted GH43/DUF377 family glycosyl hydrolase
MDTKTDVLREYYERVGEVNNVVFSCGAILEDDGLD